MQNTYLPLLVAFITAIFGPIIVEKVKPYISKSKSKKAPLLTYIEDGLIVKEAIDTIKTHIQCDRIWITQFHNGSNFWPSETSILKFSTTYETVSQGIRSRSNIFSNLPVSLFAKSLKHLYDKGEILIPTYNDPSIDTYGLGAFYHDLEPKSTYIFALFNIKNQFIGTLGIEWNSDENIMGDNNLEYLRDKSISVGALLETYLLSKTS